MVTLRVVPSEAGGLLQLWEAHSASCTTAPRRHNDIIPFGCTKD